MKNQIMFLLGLTCLPNLGFCQSASISVNHRRGSTVEGLKPRPFGIVPFRLHSSNLLLKLIDSISSASSSGLVSSFVYAEVVDPVYDASGKAVIPSGQIMRLHYTVIPGRSLH